MPDREVPVPDPARPGAVLFAVDVVLVSDFYAAVLGAEVTAREEDHVVLDVPGFQLVVHAVPASVVAGLPVSGPPTRRTDCPVKLVLPVASIAAVRAVAEGLGGTVDPPGREWRFQADRVCDGHDPEGNVLQLREPAR